VNQEKLVAEDSLTAYLVTFNRRLSKQSNDFHFLKTGERGDAGVTGDKGYAGIGFNITGPPG
jgi:hypothetical protein